MQLNKKSTYIPGTYSNTPKEYPKGEPVDYRVYELDPDAVIGHGKYVGKTLGYVMRNDDNYINWMDNNNLFTSWGLIRKKAQPKKKVDYVYDQENWLITESDTWIGLREVNDQYRQSIYL